MAYGEFVVHQWAKIRFFDNASVFQDFSLSASRVAFATLLGKLG